MAPLPLIPAPHRVGDEITYYSLGHNAERRGFIRMIVDSVDNQRPYRLYHIVDNQDQLADPDAPVSIPSYLFVERLPGGRQYAIGIDVGQQQQQQQHQPLQQGGRTRRFRKTRRASRNHKSRRAAKHRSRR